MKKILCFIVAFCMLSALPAFAERHLEVKCSFAGSMDGRSISLDLYEQEGKTTAFSSLFPDNAVEYRQNSDQIFSGLMMLLSIRPETIPDMLETADQLFTGFLNQKISEPVTDRYAGVLFEQAAESASAVFPLTEMLDYVCEALSVKKQSETAEALADTHLKTVAETVHERYTDDNIILSVQCFEHNRFITVKVIMHGNIIMTVSADRMYDNGKYYLVSYKENQRYYFRDITCQYKQDTMTVLSSIRSGISSSYLNNNKDPLFTETLSLTNGTDQDVHFVYELYSKKISEPFIMSGSIEKKNNGVAGISAEAGIHGLDHEKIALTAVLETTENIISIPEKITIHADNTVENAGLSITVATNAAMLAAELLPSLPIDYQDMVLKLFYP